LRRMLTASSLMGWLRMSWAYPLRRRTRPLAPIPPRRGQKTFLNSEF